MPIRIEEMYISPVKSLALQRIESAYLDKPGIAGDRAFWIADAADKLVTQREHASLVQVRATYDVARDHLRLEFPGGQAAEGHVELGDAVTTNFFGERPAEGRATLGGWSEALSEFTGDSLRLIKAERAGLAFDGYPISMCSRESLAALARAAGIDAVDGRRFRQNLYISGVASAHGEDEWLGGEVRAGNAVMRVKMRDSRCVVTTHDPDTGDTDLNTLKIIPTYRTDQPKQVNFGVYCTVIRPGTVAVGDAVEPIGAPAPA